MTSCKRHKVILAYPKVDHEKDYLYFWMPYSLLTLAKPLIDDDIAEVLLFDGNQADIVAWNRFLDEHLADCVCIGFSLMTGGGQIGHALDLIREAKKRPNCPPVVAGGPHVNVLGEQTAEHILIDAVLQGPGHRSMPHFVKAMLDKSNWGEVPGLIAATPNGLIRGKINPPTTDAFGSYPWHLIDVSQYIRDDATVASKTLNYVSSLGCVYKCQFCYELTYKSKYSAMTTADLIDDLAHLQAEYGINGVKFYDADWFVNPKRAVAFCEEVMRRDLNLSWAASINPNDIIKARRTQPDLLQKVAASGCTRLLMGMDSGSDRVLDEIIKKNITRAQLKDVAAEIANHGILGSYSFIVGFPGETVDEVEETYALIEEMRTLTPTPETRVHLFAPYPGTPLYNEALRFGFIPPTDLEGWSSFDYCQSHTPWTSQATVDRARLNTRMVMATGET